jgi:hypothetical protein
MDRTLEALRALWRDRPTPYGRYICRQCAPHAFPDEAFAPWPADAQHVADRFEVSKLFGVTFDIWLDGRRPGPCAEARAGSPGWVIEYLPAPGGRPGAWLRETLPCGCAEPPGRLTRAERLRIGTVTIRPHPLLGCTLA